MKKRSSRTILSGPWFWWWSRWRCLLKKLSIRHTFPACSNNIETEIVNYKKNNCKIGIPPPGRTPIASRRFSINTTPKESPRLDKHRLFPSLLETRQTENHREPAYNHNNNTYGDQSSHQDCNEEKILINDAQETHLQVLSTNKHNKSNRTTT